MGKGVKMIRWRILYESVQGQSHSQRGEPCQDSCIASSLDHDGQSFLVAVCSDGAGSGKLSEKGSALACTTILTLIASKLDAGISVESLTREVALEWFDQTRQVLHDEARRLEANPRDLACTLLVAIVGERSAAFIQLGDGGIVILEDGTYKPVFWPQNGEYVNLTNFITDEESREAILFDARCGRIDQVALFTDGIQMVTLDFAAKAAHAPFFSPLFSGLLKSESDDQLKEPLRGFLGSPRISERTDDDRTLVLAAREPNDGQTTTTV
jgi:hypothetical protein